MTLTFLELQQIHCEATFGDIKSIAQIIEMTEPPLHYNTVMNAINKGKLTACLLPTAGEGTGIWIVHLPSARNLWGKRFIAKELKCRTN